MKKICVVVLSIATIFLIAYLFTRTPVVTVDKDDRFEECSALFKDNIIKRINSEKIITVNGISVDEFNYEFNVSNDMVLFVESDFVRSLLNCAVLEYSDGKILVMKGDVQINLKIDSDKASIVDGDDVDLGANVYCEDDKIFIPFDNIARYFSYEVDYYLYDNHIDLAVVDKEIKLPARYDMRDYDRVSPVRDQGRYGTCWAFASLGALETTVRPKCKDIYSTDHMTLSNSYNLGLNKGGEHTMSIAYMAAWQGPVLEEDDPYGDGETNPKADEVKHLEEALVINNKEYDIVKSAIYRYGAVETSIYSQMEYVDSVSQYYSTKNSAYYYDGEEIPNHDVVIVGWDDNYPKENFTIEPDEDGAFICKNSWGTEFGEDGYFYVSYEDTNICNKAVVYTRVNNSDNFDKIYQSDMLGWVGLMGFGKEEAYFANVYTTDVNEELAAVSFYATDKNTEFEVYLVQNFENDKSFANKEFLISGSMKYAGYYTVDIPTPVRLTDKSKFAVVVKVKTPGAIHPIAIEYNVDDRTENFDISDGEGYISLYGELWHNAEKSQNCNVCLKAFTNKVDDSKNSEKKDAGKKGAEEFEKEIEIEEVENRK